MDLVHIDTIFNLGIPHVAEKIFKSLSVNDLNHCQQVSNTWMVLTKKILAEKILLQKWKGKLLEACQEGKTEIVRILLEYGDDTELNTRSVYSLCNRKPGWRRSGLTPFAMACKNGHEAVAELLVNHPYFDVDSVDRCGRTNLMWASEKGFHKTVQRLLSKMDITAINKRDEHGTTALMFAQNDSC